jgi:hypothetical protein
LKYRLSEQSCDLAARRAAGHKFCILTDNTLAGLPLEVGSRCKRARDLSRVSGLVRQVKAICYAAITDRIWVLFGNEIVDSLRN